MNRTSRQATALLLAALVLIFIASAAAVEAGSTGNLLGLPAGAVSFVLALIALSKGLFNAASSAAGRSG